MVATQDQVRADDSNVCPVCFLSATDRQEDENGHFVCSCPRCGRVWISEYAKDELATSFKARREVQWINRNFLQGPGKRRRWVTGSGPLDNPIISLDELDSFGIPREIGAWRDDTIRRISKLPGGYRCKELLKEVKPAFWYPEPDDLDWMLRQLEAEGLLTVDPNTAPQVAIDCWLNLTHRFWTEAEELERRANRKSSQTVFVASWFANEVAEDIRQGIVAAISEVGYAPVWLRDAHTLERIDDKIFAGIRSARFVVADMTGWRQAVLFEAGFAQGLGIPAVFTCRRRDFDDAKDRCFDTQQFPHILWDSAADLKSQLIDRMRALDL